PAGAMVEIAPHRLADIEHRHLLAKLDFVRQTFRKLPAPRMRIGTVYFFPLCGTQAGDMQHVGDPRSDRLHQHLCALALQEPEDMKIPIALCCLRPEFAGNLYDVLYLQAIYVDT